ncbi:hypothetical protein K439DRAFT_1261600, partial [Ramaria rubella]
IMTAGQQWDLEIFFEELFNYCFPPNFRSEQRRKLASFIQRELPVQDYACQTRVLSNSIGD